MKNITIEGEFNRKPVREIGDGNLFFMNESPYCKDTLFMMTSMRDENRNPDEISYVVNLEDGRVLQVSCDRLVEPAEGTLTVRRKWNGA